MFGSVAIAIIFVHICTGRQPGSLGSSYTVFKSKTTESAEGAALGCSTGDSMGDNDPSLSDDEARRREEIDWDDHSIALRCTTRGKSKGFSMRQSMMRPTTRVRSAVFHISTVKPSSPRRMVPCILLRARSSSVLNIACSWYTLLR